MSVLGEREDTSEGEEFLWRVMREGARPQG